MLAKSLAKGKGGAVKGGPPLERQASAPQSMPTVRESASLRTEDESVSSDGGPAPLQPLDRRRGDTDGNTRGASSSGDSAYDPAQRPLDRSNGMPPIATSSSGSSELPPHQGNQQSSQSGSCSPPKPPDETDGFAGVPVSKPQPIPGSGSPPAEAPPLPPPSPFKNEAPITGGPGPSVPSSAETPKVLSSSVDSDGVHNSADSLHGVSAAVRRAKQELMFFASVGDLKRCTILARTAKQLYNADITDCQDWDARRPLHAAAVHGCYQVCKWLLKVERVPPSPVDKFGRTPLADAVRGDHMEVIALLQKYGGKVRDPEGRLVDYQIFNVKSLEEAVMREWEIDPADIRLGEKIGEGEFGIVFKAEWHSSTVAVKMLKRSDSIAMNDFRTELDVLQKMHHPNLVQFLGACTRSKPYMLVLEYLPGGSLADLLKNPELHPSLRRAIVMALDCAKAMTYLHAHMRQMVLHRDLKPANLLIGGIHAAPDNTSYVGARYGMVKVADFGLSRVTTLLKADLTPATSIASRMDSRNDSRNAGLRQDSVNDTVNSMNLRARSSDELDKEVYNYTGETGTYRYMAPEVYRHEPYNGKADVYSFAMICYELFEGRKPFSEMNATAAARAASLFDRRPPWGKVNRFQKTVPTALKELVTECWSPAMDDRPDFGTITRRLEHIAKALPEVRRLLRLHWLHCCFEFRMSEDEPCLSAFCQDLDENSLIGSGGCCAPCCVQ